MSSLLIGCSALETSAPGPTAGPSWWERLARRVANEYRVRRAEREVADLDERTLRDIGLEYAARTFPASSRRCSIEAIEHRHWWPMSRASILQSSAA